MTEQQQSRAEQKGAQQSNNNAKQSAQLDTRYDRNVQGSTEKLKRAKVAICGCGGLGSNIAIALARVGVGHLFLVDFDTIEPSNLNRQQFFEAQVGQPKPEALKWMIAQINSEVQVETQQIRITKDNAEELLQGYDIICEAFDNPAAKAELATTYRKSEVLKGIPYVGGSGMAGIGNSNTIQTREIAQNFYICGDMEISAQMGGGLMAPRVIICAGHQANKIVELLAENKEQGAK